MPTFQLICLLFYNTWISSKSKFSVWPSWPFGVFGSIEQ